MSNQKEYHKIYYQKHKEKIKEQSKKYRKKNPEKIEKNAKQWKLNNPEKVKENNKIYYQNYKEKIKQQVKKYRKENPEKIKKYRKENPEYQKEIDKKYYQNHKKEKAEYNQNHKKEINEYSKNWQKQRRATDPQFKLNGNMARSIRLALKGKKAGGKWETLVGYTLKDLVKHIEKQFEPWMTWQNYGKWHIDHIRPKSFFKFKNIESSEFRKCWALSNLQPLEAIENLRKYNK